MVVPSMLHDGTWVKGSRSTRSADASGCFTEDQVTKNSQMLICFRCHARLERAPLHGRWREHKSIRCHRSRGKTGGHEYGRILRRAAKSADFVAFDRLMRSQ